MILGVDTSRHSGRINFSKMVDAGAVFWITKATDANRTTGAQFEDERFDEYCQAVDKRLLTGCYHWLQNSLPARNAADYYLQRYRRYQFDFAPIMDFEEKRVLELGQQAAYAQKGREWCEYVKLTTGLTPIIYTANWYTTQFAKHLIEWMKDYPLWVADYTAESNQTGKPIIPYPWQSWQMWQFSADKNKRGAEFGLSADDACLDYFNGTMDELQDFTGGTKMEVLFRARCKVSSLTIRKGAGIGHDMVGWISQGDIVDVLEVASNGWFRIGVSRWISGHEQYMERIDETLPEPSTEPLKALYWPCDERWPVSQVFGVNQHWYPNTGGHNGVDFAIPVGNPIYAAADGVVIVSRAETTGYGRHIRIRHSHGVTIYGHMSRNDVRVGDVVKGKQIIGLSGGATSDPYSGMSTGPHLHFEYRWDKQAPQVPGSYLYNAVDPMPLLVSHDDADTLFRARCIVDGLRVRILPSTGSNSNIIGHLVRGQVVNVVEVSENNWFRIGVGRWVSGSPTYMEKLDEPIPPTPPEPEPPILTLEQRVERIEQHLGL